GAWPALHDFVRRSARLHEPGVLELVRGGRAPEPGRTARAWFNLTDRPQPLPAAPGAGEAVLFASEAGRYGGDRGPGVVADLRPFECVVVGPADWRRLAP